MLTVNIYTSVNLESSIWERNLNASPFPISKKVGWGTNRGLEWILKILTNTLHVAASALKLTETTTEIQKLYVWYSETYHCYTSQNNLRHLQNFIFGIKKKSLFMKVLVVTSVLIGRKLQIKENCPSENDLVNYSSKCYTHWYSSCYRKFYSDQERRY